MAEYRPVPAGDADRYREVLNYAFRGHEGPLGADADEHCYPSFGERRGLYVDDDLRAISRNYVLDARLRGTEVPLAGFTVVATPPEHRRRGYVSELTRAALVEYRDRDLPLVALWPFDYDFYRAYGWGVANHYATYTLPPETLAFAADSVDSDEGRFRRLSPDDHAVLEPVLAAHNTAHDLTIRRPEGWWRERTFARHDRERFVYAWEHDGDVRAYLAYRIEPLETVDEQDTGETQLRVHDAAWTDHDAHGHLLRFLHGHAGQVDTVQLTRPADHALLDLLPRPDDVDCSVSPGPMVRVVDVPTAVEALDYPTDVSGTVVVAVTDDQAAWNDDTFELAVGDGDATCTRLDDPDVEDRAAATDTQNTTAPTDTQNTTAATDVELDVARLSQLLVGARSLEDMARVGHATVHDANTAAVLSAMYPESSVYLREFF